MLSAEAIMDRWCNLVKFPQFGTPQWEIPQFGFPPHGLLYCSWSIIYIACFMLWRKFYKNNDVHNNSSCTTCNMSSILSWFLVINKCFCGRWSGKNVSYSTDARSVLVLSMVWFCWAGCWRFGVCHAPHLVIPQMGDPPLWNPDYSNP